MSIPADRQTDTQAKTYAERRTHRKPKTVAIINRRLEQPLQVYLQQQQRICERIDYWTRSNRNESLPRQQRRRPEDDWHRGEWKPQQQAMGPTRQSLHANHLNNTRTYIHRNKHKHTNTHRHTYIHKTTQM